MRLGTCSLFDLDGSLVDSVYQHVLAWSQALDEEGIALSRSSRPISARCDAASGTRSTVTTPAFE